MSWAMTPVIKLQVILIQATLYLLILAAIFDVITSSYQDNSSYEEQTQEAECGRYIPRGLRRRSSHRIAGGYPALFNEFPSYVHIRTDSSHYCGGTIISGRYVLTSAHCLKRTKDGPITRNATLNAGTVVNVKATTRRIGVICMPEQFSSLEESDLDVAMLMVDPPWAFGAGIEPACMPSRAVVESDAAYVVGFGVDDKKADTNKKKLQVLPVKKLPNCDYFEETASKANRICFASSDDQFKGDACAGDGGGPVYANINGRQSIVGILLGGTNSCQAGNSKPSQYLDVYRYREEIRNLIGGNCIHPG